MAQRACISMTIKVGVVLLCAFLLLSLPLVGLAQPDPLQQAVDQATVGQQQAPSPTSADYNSFVLLSGIPYVTDATTLPELLNQLYKIAIILGAVFAVVRLTIAGLQYMGSDSFGSKTDAKNSIKEVLIGLLILLSTWLILQTIFGTVDIKLGGDARPINMAPTTWPGVAGQVPAGVTTDIKPLAGCNQMGAGGGTCTTGNVAVITQTRWDCVAPSSLTQSANGFRTVTEKECRSYGMGAMIAKKIVGGVHVVSSLGSDSTDSYIQKLTSQCTGSLPGGTVTKIRDGYLGGDYVFVCSK